MPRGAHWWAASRAKGLRRHHAALAQATAAPLEPLFAPPSPPPGFCLSWVTATDPDPFGIATTVSMHILHDGETVGTTMSEAEELA